MQIKKRGGAGSEADKDELATGVLQHLANRFHGAHPQSLIGLRNSKDLKTIAVCTVALLAGAKQTASFADLSSAGSAPRLLLPDRRMALRGSNVEERETPRNLTPWGDRYKSQRGANLRR